MYKLGLLVILGTTGVTHAQSDSEEPPPPQAPAPREGVHGFVGGGVSLGVDHFLSGALVLEGALKLPQLPVWLHAMGSKGGSMDFEGTGDYLRGLAGIELRGCRRTTTACAFADLDAGYLRQTWGDGEPEDFERHHGLVVGPRIGIDAGSASTRFRLALEAQRYHHTAEFMTGATRETTEWETAASLVMTVVARL